MRFLGSNPGHPASEVKLLSITRSFRRKYWLEWQDRWRDGGMDGWRDR